MENLNLGTRASADARCARAIGQIRAASPRMGSSRPHDSHWHVSSMILELDRPLRDARRIESRSFAAAGMTIQRETSIRREERNQTPTNT
jgi:hypothetical protein